MESNLVNALIPFIEVRFFGKLCFLTISNTDLKLDGLNYLMQSLRGQVVNAERPIETWDQKIISSKAKFEVFGEEMLGKEVKISGNSGRVYLPPTWIGKRVKIIRID